MKIILVNAPKGGVGKTTLSTNIALYLKLQGYSVLALDVAQGTLMTEHLEKSNHFSTKDFTILTQELETTYTNSLDKVLKKKQFDFIVVDTDDYYKILTDFPKTIPSSAELLILIPIVDEPNTRERITQEIKNTLIGYAVQNHTIDIKLVCNKCTATLKNRPKKIVDLLKDIKLDTLLTHQMIHLAHTKHWPYYINCPIFNTEIESLLREVKVIP